MMFDLFSGSMGAAIALIAVAAILSRMRKPPQTEPRAVPFHNIQTREQHASSIPDEIDHTRPGVANLEKRLGVSLLPHEIIAFMTFESRTGQRLVSRKKIPAGLEYLNALQVSGEVSTWIAKEHAEAE